MSIINLLQGSRLSDLSEVTLQLLKALKVPVTSATVQQVIEEHPNASTLYSISDSLKKWKVDNVCLQVEPHQLLKLPVPFLAHLHSNGGHFAVVTEVSEDKVVFRTTSNAKTVKTLAAFKQEWTGVVLLAEANKNAGEKDYASKRRKQWLARSRMPFILMGFLLLIGLSFYSAMAAAGNIMLQPALLAILKLIGGTLAGLLLWYEVDKANPILQQICTSGKQTNCNAVLESKGAKFFNGISWSEVGFVYFAGGCLFLLFSAHALFPAYVLLGWLNLLALPYVAFSIVYQWKVVKQWCPLCLGVQGVLIAELITSAIGYQPSFLSTSFTPATLVTALAAFSLPVFLWLFIKPVLLKAHQASRFRKEAAWLKYNPQLFPALLSTQKSIAASTEGLGITIGNPAAKNTIIKVCNPFCGPCAKAHQEIEALLENKDIKVQIIFVAMNREGDIRSGPVKHFLSLYEGKEESLLIKALDDWYGAPVKDYATFAQQYPLDNDVNHQGYKLDAMMDWCKETEISYTPTFFINGYQLPNWYKVEDLKYLL